MSEKMPDLFEQVRRRVEAERTKKKREELEKAKVWRNQLLLDDIRDELRRIATALENLSR